MQTVKDTWADALAGYSADEIRRGLGLCQTRIFPPTLPEFLMLCRPPVDPESAYIEACKQMSARDTGTDVWSSPAIFWSARDFGVHELRGSTWQTAKARWTRILDDHLAKTSHEPVPKRMVCLPEPGKGTADPEKVKAAMELLRRSLASKSAAFTDET
jgi:hypothetical protein